MKRMLAAGIAWVLMGAAPALAQTRFYLGGHGGWNFLTGADDLDDDAVAGGAVGVDFGGPAVEAAFNYSKHDSRRLDLPIVDADVAAEMRILAVTLDARYNFDLDFLRPYLAIGGGWYRLDFEPRVTGGSEFAEELNERLGDEQEDAFGLNAGGGIEIWLGNHLTIGPDVRYHVVFTDNFDSEDALDDTELEDVPDFVAVMGRLNVYF